MTSTAARPATVSRRGRLTQELIVAESLRLLDEHGSDGFSLPKLGRAIGADPTAVYRHFGSKDDLVLAIADRLIAEAMAMVSPQPCWVDTIEQAIRALRATYCAHPAAAALAWCRTTQRPAEMTAVNTIIEAVLQAGFAGAQAALVYRTIGDFSLAWAGFEAAFLALDAGQQRADRAAWTRAYLTVDRADYPHIWQIRQDLAGVTDNAIFERVMSTFLTGLRHQAPVPCTCDSSHPRTQESSGGRAHLSQAAHDG